MFDHGGRAAFAGPAVDENIKFVPREMMRDLDVRFFYRDGEDALRDAERGGVVCGNMVEE
jgi:hypothetical protein